MGNLAVKEYLITAILAGDVSDRDLVGADLPRASLGGASLNGRNLSR
ncbi:MAG: low-complexity protein, partial [Anaerolineae bacterium]|nr:low-complexity protein [Gloeobacterales cyanobacterium ES-bin-313]